MAELILKLLVMDCKLSNLIRRFSRYNGRIVVVFYKSTGERGNS